MAGRVGDHQLRAALAGHRLRRHAARPEHGQLAGADLDRVAVVGPGNVLDPDRGRIADLAAPDYGDPVDVRAGEVPVFWACGVTPQAAAAESRPALMITHAPGHMFVTDLLDESQSVL